MYAQTDTDTHAHAHTKKEPTDTDMHMHIHLPPPTQTRTHTRTHACTHARTRARDIYWCTQTALIVHAFISGVCLVFCQTALTARALCLVLCDKRLFLHSAVKWYLVLLSNIFAMTNDAVSAYSQTNIWYLHQACSLSFATGECLVLSNKKMFCQTAIKPAYNIV